MEVLHGAKMFPREQIKFPKKNATSLGNDEFSPRKSPSSPRKHMFQIFLQLQPSRDIYVSNLFVITSISCSFLYKLATYHWNFFKENHSLICSYKHFNQNSYEKVMITQSFKHIELLPWEQPCPLGINGPKLPQGATMSPWEKGSYVD